MWVVKLQSFKAEGVRGHAPWDIFRKFGLLRTIFDDCIPRKRIQSS